MPKVMLPLAAQPLWLSTAALAAGPWEPVCAPVRLTASAASVSFAVIPAQYVMFRLRLEVISSGDSSISVRFNNDSGANYSRQQMEVNNITVTARRLTSQTNIQLQNNGVDASASATHDVVIVKSIAAKAALLMNTGSVMTSSGLMLIVQPGKWANTADLINRIDVSSDYSTFTAGSILILQGSKF